MITDVDFLATLDKHCLVRGRKILPRGHIRADTRLIYPDGATISVFIERGNLVRPNGFALSDLGKTFEKLTEYGVNPFRPKTRFDSIEQTVGDLGVRVMSDRLVLELADIDDLQYGIINLAQACLRSSCMIFNRRAYQQRRIQEMVKDVVLRTGLPFDSGYPFSVPFKNNVKVKVDYRVMNPSKASSILVLKGSHAQANEILRRWHDLKKANVADSFLTIYDDQAFVEKPEDIERLNDVSSVLSIQYPNMIEGFLKAAA